MKNRKFRQGLAVAVALLMTINYAGRYLGRSPVVSLADTAATVSATSLNVRSGPGTGNSIVGKLTYGESVSVAGETQGSDGNVWYQIYYTKNGTQVSGYVRSDYIKFPTTYQSDADFENYMTNQGFPESYKPGLRQIHAEYPNWVFTAQHTNLDWNEVIDNESVVGRNLVAGSSPSSWKSTESGAYNWETGTWPSFDSGSWVAASRDVVSYYMDPRNFLNEKYVFQFLKHNYNSSIHTIDGIKNMVQGTFLDDSVDVSKSQSSSGTEDGTGTGGPDEAQDIGNSGNSPGSPGTGPGAAGPGASSGSGSGTSSGTGGPGVSGSSGTGDVTVQPGVSPGSDGAAQGSSGNSGTGTSGGGDGVQAGASPGTGGVNQEAPSGSGNSDVSLQAPGASVSRNRAYRVGTAIGPGVPAPSSSGDTYSAPIATYAEIIMNAASQSGVNPYVLTAMILQEQGSQGSRSVSGTVSGYEGYYNFFNIEAYKSGSMEAVERGLWYASQSGSYERPWNSVDKAILGGAVYYGTNYVNAGQDTFYLKKFNVQGENLYKHQYMTNVEAAASEGAKLNEAYSSQLKQLALEFKIPVYKNMPDNICPLPSQDGSPNNKLSSMSIDGYTLTPTFNRDVTVYNLIVDSSVTMINVRASALDSGAVITGIGNIQLQSGDQDIVIEVKAPNGASCQYVIHVVRQGSGSSPGSSQQTGTSAGPGAVGPGVTGSTAESVSVEIITDGPAGSGDSQEGQHTGPGGSDVTIVQ